MMWWPLVAAVVVVGLWLAVVLRRRFTEPAGAPPLLILDNSRFAAAKLFRGDTGRLIAEAASKYGNVFTVDMLWFKQIVITDIDAVDLILTNKDDTLSFHETNRVMHRGMLGVGPTKLRPESEYADNMNRLVVALQKHKKEYFQNIQSEVNEWAAALAGGKPFDFYAAVNTLITNINIHCFIGKDLRATNGPAFKTLYEELERRGYTTSTLLFPWLPFGDGWKCEEIRGKIAAILKPIIEGRKKQYEESGIQHVDYLNEYLVAPHKHNNKPWTTAEITQASLLTFFAARVNTLLTFFWSALSIAAHPEELAKLREELDEQEVTIANMKGFKYIEYCIKEAVRPLYTLRTNRRLMKDIEFKGVRLPKGYFVYLSSFHFNRDPSVFSQPEKFIPERWSPDSPLIHTENKNAFLFFGCGQHRCKGEDFAWLVLRVALSTIFKNYDFKWVDQKEEGELPPYRLGVSMAYPSKPVMVTLTPRKHTSK